MKPRHPPPACVSKSEKKLMVSEPREPSSFPQQIAWRPSGRGPAQLVLCLQLPPECGQWDAGLKESVAKAGTRDSFGPS